VLFSRRFQLHFRRKHHGKGQQNSGKMVKSPKDVALKQVSPDAVRPTIVNHHRC
jgi:hypothetical protein